MELSELQSCVHQHRIFFDHLVELVPAKFYIPKEDQEKNWHYGMSKAERAAAKRETKENLKKARRDRLDPDKFTSTLKLLQQQENTVRSEDLEEKDEAGHAAHNKLRGKESRASTYEELRERLHKRIEMLRTKRNADAAADAAKKARNWQNEKKLDSQKRKRKNASARENAEAKLEMPAVKRKKHASGKLEGADRKEGLSEAPTFEFGRVKMGLDSSSMNGKKRKHKESKEQLLVKATKLQQDVQDPEKGQELALKHSWSVAVSRASGEKVFDDPSLLKRSIKKEKHQRQRSSKKWLDRKETVNKAAEEKQQNRLEHIKERKQQKKDRKIAKREKKLLRPGFEGRKQGFINE